MSDGLSHLSDADLMRMLGQGAPAPVGASSSARAPDLSHLSDDELMKQLRSVPEPSTASSAAWDVAKSIPSGLARGAMSLAGLPADAMNLLDRGWQNGMSYVLEKSGALTPEQAYGIKQPIPGLDGTDETRTRGILPSSGLLKDGADAGLKRVGLPKMHKPQTVPGELANTLAEFAPNVLGGSATALGKLAQVAVPALASEGLGQAARHLAPEYEATARFAGAIGGGVGTAMAQAPRGAGMVREGLDGFSPETLAAAQAFRAEARALPGGGIDIPLDEALNHVTGGQASRLSQIARVVANSGGEGQRIAGQFYAARPGQVDATGRAAFDAMAEKNASPTALGGSVQDAARAGLMDTPQGVALTEARAAAGPRVTPEQAGEVIQPALRGTYDRREGMRAALADRDYAAAREAPETIGIERPITVERPGEPVIAQPALSRPQFEQNAPRPLEPYAPPVAEDAGPAGESLARFIARNGGLRLDGDAAATDLQRFVVPGVGKVARTDGKSLDNFWRERLIEEGYFRPDADGGMARDISSELLRKLQNEQRGFPSYPLGGAGRARGRSAAGMQADDYANAKSLAESRFDADLAQSGVDPRSVHPDIRERVIGAVMRGEHADPLDAYERTVGAMKGPLAPYSKSTTVVEEIPDVRFGQANPADVVGHIDEALRTAKGPVAMALQQARKTLFEPDGKTLDLSVAGLHGAREAISDLIDKAPAQTQRALLGVRERLDRSLAAVPEYEHARSGFEAASRTLDPFDASAAPGRIVAQDRASGRFAMPAERAPGAIDEGPSGARAFNAVANPEAQAAYEGHLTTRLLDGATDAATGEVSGKALRTAMRANEDVLAQFPAVRGRLLNVAMARDGMAAVERSPLGRIAKKPDLKRAIGVLFDREPLAGGEGEVGAAMGALAKANPSAARQLARIHMETVFDDAVRDTRGLPAQYGGAGFASAVAGNPQQAKNLEAAIRALPEGGTLWAGLDRFLSTLKATGYRPQKGSDTFFNTVIREEMKGDGSVRAAIGNVVGGATAGGSAAGLGGGLAGGLLAVKRTASDAFTRYQIGRNGEAVARMLFDPKALPDLRALSKSPVGSRNAEVFTGRLIALANGRASQEGSRDSR